MENTRFMSRMFSAVNENDEELLNQVDTDIKTANKDGKFDTDELSYVALGENKVEVTDKENGEQTIIEMADDGAYDLYPAGVEIQDEQIEGFAHPEEDGVTPGDQTGAPDEKVEDHNPETELPGTVEENAEENAEDETCPECGKNPCECESEEEEGDEEDEEEKTYSGDNSVVARIFSDQEFCERIFSEVIESEETAKVGALKIEKLEDEDNAVVVTDENTGDQAKVVMDEDEMDVQELDSKNFSEEGEEMANEEEFMPLHVVGVDTFNHQIVDSACYDEESANDLVARLQEVGVDGVAVFDNEEAARDYAISLLNGLGADSYDEPEQVEFSEHDVFVTPFHTDNTAFMTRLFSEACNEIDATQNTIENVIETGNKTETATEIITPVDEETVIVEDKDNGELTKVVLDDETLECEPISEEDANEMMADEEKTYSNNAETKFFSSHEYMTEYMCRLFSEEADEKDIEKAIEENEQVETESEIITPVDNETAVIEDKENGEYTKATMTEDDIEVVPISEEEAADLTEEKTYSNEAETKFFSSHEYMTEYMCRLFSDEASEEDIEKAIEDGEVVETETEVITPVDEETAVIKDKENGEYTKAVLSEEDIDLAPISEENAEEMIKENDETEEEVKDEEEKPETEEEKKDEEKTYSYMDKFFANVPVHGAEAAEPEVVKAVYDENGNLVPLVEEEEATPSVEAIEDAALAAVQAINNAATESVNAIMEAKNTPAEDEQAELQEAQFSDSTETETTDTNDTMISWLNSNIL